ncbi:hypothetical protein SLE2022_194290 [Rubroshorea leprosula]
MASVRFLVNQFLPSSHLEFRSEKAVFNFTRTSTEGFSMGNILLDFAGGLANYAQMAMQSIDQNSLVGKTLLSLVWTFSYN